MKIASLTLLMAGLLALAATSSAQPRYVTLDLPVDFPVIRTNSLVLAPYEVAELVSFPTVANPREIWFKRSGYWYLRQDTLPFIIAGPATIELQPRGAGPPSPICKKWAAAWS